MDVCREAMHVLVGSVPQGILSVAWREGSKEGNAKSECELDVFSKKMGLSLTLNDDEYFKSGRKSAYKYWGRGFLANSASGGGRSTKKPNWASWLLEGGEPLTGGTRLGRGTR